MGTWYTKKKDGTPIVPPQEIRSGRLLDQLKYEGATLVNANDAGSAQRLSGAVAQNDGGDGPSAGPSNGPNISLTFPGYYAANNKVEEQYAQWRDARRAAGEDPYDMTAFRQHLIGIGAPDPLNPASWPNGGGGSGSGGNNGGNGNAPVPSTPVTNPGNTPYTPPAGTTPGTVFDPARKTGSFQDLVTGFNGINMPEADIERLFPFLTDPTFAANNQLRQAGITPGAGNPFAEFLGGKLPQYNSIAYMQNVLGGGTGKETDIAGQTQRVLGGGITGASGEALLPQLADVARRYRADPTSVTTAQGAMYKEFLENPEKALSTLGTLRNVSPAMRGAVGSVNKDLLERFKNKAAANPNFTVFDFLGI